MTIDNTTEPRRDSDTVHGLVRRVQLSRRKGYRMPPNTVKVARPTKWGNPFRVGNVCAETPAKAVALYAKWLRDDNDGLKIASEARMQLAGKNLACFCRLDQPCHADVLLRVANTKEQARAGSASPGSAGSALNGGQQK